MIPLSPIGIVFTLVAAVLILALPRRWAVAPLMASVCYMVLSQGIEIGPFSFFVIRIIVLVGLARLVIRHEFPNGGLNRLDWVVIVWAAWVLLCSVFRDNPSETLVSNLGLAFNICGVYFLLRSFLTTAEDVRFTCRLVVVLLVPVAIEMALEQIRQYNLFSALGGVPEVPAIREGRLRSQGPFAHAILAGTTGAACLPIALALWNSYRVTSIVGACACVVIVITSASSSPLMSAMFATAALCMWPIRNYMKWVRLGILAGYLLLELVMKAPAYYILARIDVAGGSTGWHRAQLINAAFSNFSEWWLAGTDYTRHWMPTGVSWSPNHTDITNYYLDLGVRAGFPATLLFIGMLVVGYSMAGTAIRRIRAAGGSDEFLVWALGCSLFAHTATSIAVAYFDQSFAFIYLTLVAIVTMAGATAVEPSAAPQKQPPARPESGRPAAPRVIPVRRRAPHGAASSLAASPAVRSPA